MKTTKQLFLAAALCLCCAFSANAAYSGRPATPKQISDENYATYGFTVGTYLAYENWYAISNAEELYGFAALVNNSNDHEKINGVITADIVVNENVLNTDGTLNGTPTHSWTPIGTYENKFAGKFDGQGHTISGLYFSNTTNRNYPSGGNYAGLFGYVSNLSCIVSNVGIVDSYIKGNLDVGSICGCADSYSTITNCYNTGAVMGNSHVSGICGKAIDYSTITNCYNIGAVMGSNYNIGGICGLNNSSTITNCYNTGTIKGSSYYVGGICGRNSSSTITNCYYLPGCAKDGNNVVQYGIGNSAKGKTSADISGKTTSSTTEEFASGKIAYLLNGSVSGGTVWHQNLNGEKDVAPVLDINHGLVYASQPCPFSNNESGEQEHDIVNGICSLCYLYDEPSLVDGWYEIDNAGKLYWFADAVNSGSARICGKLTADILVNENVLNTNGELNGTSFRNWTPIGGLMRQFNGKFEGQGHTISGLYFNNTADADFPSGGNRVGLFGFLSDAYSGDEVTISNVGIIDSYLEGNGYVGGICGEAINYITISNCYYIGIVKGHKTSFGSSDFSNVGGICGCATASSSITITNCYNSGTVEGEDYYVGGICGDAYGYVSITNCLNTGTVLGTIFVGGICGYAHGDYFVSIANCYNTGTVTGEYEVGGICGRTEDFASITNCYNLGTTTGESCIGGICGNASSPSTISNCYNTGTVMGSDRYVGGVCGYAYSSTITNNYYLVGCAKDGDNIVQYGLGNSTKGQTTADVSGKTTPATTEEFASGKIAFLLNGSVSEGDLAWYQSLFSDATPVLDNTHNRVTGYIEDVDNVITVSGDLVIASDYEIAEGKTFVVLEGSSVTITTTGKITNNGSISNNGTITNNGTLVNNSVISGNNLAGAGNFAYTNLSDSDIETVTNGYTYKGTAYTLESGLSDIVKARTICGKQFTFDAAGYTVSYENNRNVGNNAKIKWEGNSTVEKTFAITPNTNVVVTITGNSSTVAYNTEEQSISGYTVEIEDATGVYTETDFIFSGSAAVSGTTVGTYSMGLSADDFSNTNTNFAEVQFVVTDGVLTINKAENAPDMPTTIETYYINTNRVALPDNWQWVENIDLEKGENTATAQYIGSDAGNYENESVEVVVTRTDCPHDEGYTTINTAEPTCTEEGYTGDHLCNICNEIFEQGESIAALGHDFKNYVYNNDATTTADGTKTAICEHGCGATDTKVAEGTKLPETPEKGTAAVDDAANAVNIYAYGNTIVVENATEEICVYNAMGALVGRTFRDAVSTTGTTAITINTPGIYIVKTGETVKRVMVND